ncbi:hypothetical protein GIB67_021387 [Kingdonia uniflora]|uniref:F-box domain-containing protein n=1 Tax=Kingdonia uniflora TaxID=39325 RepID=A0A7J7MCY7_9MAGN|nr:hypothetical protein GIB67_021387 [Kingdonia uniflora]
MLDLALPVTRYRADAHSPNNEFMVQMSMLTLYVTVKIRESDMEVAQIGLGRGIGLDSNVGLPFISTNSLLVENTEAAAAMVVEWGDKDWKSVPAQSSFLGAKKDFALLQIRFKTLKISRSSVRSICVESNLIFRVVVEMETSPVMEVSTSGHSAEYENIVSDREDEGEDADRQFRSCIVEYGEENFFLLPDLEKEKSDRGVDESIYLKYFDGNVLGRIWNDNIIWVKGDCLHREDEEPMELLYKTVKKSLHSKVKKKKSLLYNVTQEGVELKVVLKELGISRNKHANSRSEKVHKSQATRLMLGVDGNKKRRVDEERQVVLLKASVVDFTNVPESATSSKLAQTFPKKGMMKRGSASGTMGSGEAEGEAKNRRVDPPSQLIGVKVAENRLGEEDKLRAIEDRARLTAHKGVEEMSKVAARLMKGIYLGIGEEKAELENRKVEFEKKVIRLKSDLVREGKRLDSVKAVEEVEISEMGYSKAEVTIIMEDTYIKEKEDEDDVAEVVGGLDGVSPQTEQENPGYDNVNPEKENEIKDIRLRIEELEHELTKEKEASASLLSLQAELQIANVSRGGDRISNLPDVVLHRIISLLPTKEAVATSLLTKQWKHLWISISNLEFWDSSHGISLDQVKQMKDMNCKVSFMDFVERVLIRLDECDIQKFSLKCFDCYLSRIEVWINWVIRHQIPEVKLEYGVYGASLIVFLSTDFNYEILEVLKLMIKSIFKIPTSICFSRLKTLDLSRLELYGDMGCGGNHLVKEQVIKEECWEDEDFEDDMVLGYLLTHLKAPKIGILSENKNPKSKYKNSRQVDLLFVKYFFKNARVLEKMTIISSDYLSNDPKMQTKVP